MQGCVLRVPRLTEGTGTGGHYWLSIKKLRYSILSNIINLD
jgi:hypothetical protein